MDKFYIVSTLASANLYTNHERGGADLPVAQEVGGVLGVLIEGGAGVMGKNLITPEGTITEVSAEQLEYLRRNDVFKLHERNGFVKVLDSKPAPDAVAATGDMEHADEGRQLTEGDLAAEANEDGDKVDVSSAGKSTKSSKK